MVCKRGLKLKMQDWGAQEGFRARVPHPCAALSPPWGMSAYTGGFLLVLQYTQKTPAFLSVPLLPRPHSS